MALDFTTLVYNPAFSVFARTVTITPNGSQPGEPAYSGRGIYSTQPVDVPTENGAILSDQVTVLDVIEREYAVLPAQGDLVDIPASGVLPAPGQFEIIERYTNGGGETTLVLRKVMAARP